MSAGFVISNPRFKAFVQVTNAPLSGGLAYFYLTGTAQSVLQPVFAEIACITALANPVVLDVNGEANIFGNAIYDIVLKDSNNVTQDTIIGVSFSPAASSGGAASPEWLLQSGALNYLTGTTFTIAGNQTALFHPGRRIQVLVTAGNLFGTIVSSVFATSTTVTVSLDSGSLDSGLNTGSVWIGILDSQRTSIPTLNPLPSTTGGTTAYLLTVQRGDLIAGTRFQAIINATNTGPSTLSVNGGAVTAVKKQGSNALVAGDMQIGAVNDFEFDGTNYQLLNPYTVASGQIPSGVISGDSLSSIGSNNVANITNQAASSANINLAAGNWVIAAWGSVNLDNYVPTPSLKLTINGSDVWDWVIPSNAGGITSVFPVFLHGTLVVNSWGGGNLAIAIATTGTATWNGQTISALAIKIG